MDTKLILVVLTLSIGSAEKFYLPDHEFDRTPLGDAIDSASMKILKTSYDISEDKNVISSPLGVLTLLSLYSAGTEDETRQEIVKALGSNDYQKLLESYSGLSQRFSSVDPSYLTVANKVYVSNVFTLDDKFGVTARNNYKSEVETINFTNATAAAAAINKWADVKTNGHIKNPVSEDIISSDTAVGLFNVIYFQGHWHVPFDAAETEEKDFFVEKGKPVKKLTMHLRSTLFYYEDKELGASMVELPYKENGFRMIVVLPDEIDGLPSVLEKISKTGVLTDAFNMSPPNYLIDLTMPKFEVKSKLNLKEILPKVGVSRIFTDAAPGIVKGNGVKVDAAFQEAFVKVNEEGATAGAFTGFIAVPTSSFYEPPPPKPFNIDHPFLYFILHQDIILFSGIYTQ